MSCSTSTDEVYKKSAEEFFVSMNFVEALGTATISSAEIVSSPTGITITDDSILDGVVTFKIAGGVSGTNYMIIVTITTNNDQILIGEGPLKVRDR